MKERNALYTRECDGFYAFNALGTLQIDSVRAKHRVFPLFILKSEDKR